MIDPDGYRPNVAIVLMNDERRVFWAQRSGNDGWQFPQGGIHEEEPAQDAMYRELREEVGLEPCHVTLIGATEGWLRYRLPERFVRRERNPVCIGQKQRWFLLQLDADNEQLCFDTTDDPEFDRCRWVDYWRPVKEVIYFKRSVYIRALTELARAAFQDIEPPPMPATWPSSWHKR